jgi:hypothetical protein
MNDSKLMTDKPEHLPPTPLRGKRRIPLRDLRECNRLHARLVNAVLKGDLDPNTATKVAYIVSLIQRYAEEARHETWMEENISSSSADFERFRELEDDATEKAEDAE